MAALLGCAPLMAQPYVTVPVGANITIVSPGAGTPGVNQIGNGGIVRMKDPDTAGGLFSIAGVTSVTWTLYGDISIGTTNVPPAAGVYSASGLSATIETYNRRVRTPSETTLPEVVTHARSKGQVRITYTNGSCGGEFRFDIVKGWGNPATTTNTDNYAPKIVGPNCWPSPPQDVTFSVDQVASDNALDAIGFDQYYWKLTNSAGTDLFTGSTSAFYTSADRSSITLRMTDTNFGTWFAVGGPYTLQCCYGQANPWNGGASTSLTQLTTGNCCVTKVITVPLVPAYTGGFPTCVNAVSPTLPIAVNSSNPDLTNYTYSWSRTNLSWAFTTTGGGTGISINSIGDGNPCTFSLTITPVVGSTVACGVATFNYTVNRNYNFTAASLGSPFCTSPGTNVLTVNLPTNAQGNLTGWGPLPSTPAGWAVSPVGSSGGVFTIPAGAAGTTNTIQMFSSGACSAVQVPIVINVRPATPTGLTGPTCVDLGTAYSYSVAAGGTFTWTHPNWSGATTGNPVSLTPTVTPIGLISVVRDGQPGCPSLAATIQPVQKPVVTQPCLNAGIPTPGASFSAAPGSASSSWTFAAGVVNGSVFNTTGNPVSVNVQGLAGTYACSVTTNGCTTNFNVVVPASSYSASVNESDPSVSVMQATFVSTTWYQLWDCTNNVAVGGYQQGVSGFTAALTAAGPGSFAFNCDPNPLGGCIQRTNCVTTVHRSMIVNGEEGNGITLVDMDVLISPNPNQGRFNVSITHEFEQGSVTVFDAQGRRVAKPLKVMAGPNDLDLGHLKPGVYTVRTETDGEVVSKSIVITKE